MKKAPYPPSFDDELTLHILSVFFCKRETNELTHLRFMSHLSIMILSQAKIEKKIRVVCLSFILQLLVNYFMN